MSSDSHGYVRLRDQGHSSREQSVITRPHKDAGHVRFQSESTSRGPAGNGLVGKIEENRKRPGGDGKNSKPVHTTGARLRYSEYTSTSSSPARLDGSADITEFPIVGSNPGPFRLGSEDSESDNVVGASRVRSPPASPRLHKSTGTPLDLSSIPLSALHNRKKYGIEDETEGEEDEEDEEDGEDEEDEKATRQYPKLHKSAATARRLIRSHTSNDPKSLFRVKTVDSELSPGQVSPMEDDEGYSSLPKSYRGGILGSLLKLYKEDSKHFSTGETPRGTPRGSPALSGTATPRLNSPRRYEKSPNEGLPSSLAMARNSSRAGLKTRTRIERQETLLIQEHIEEILAKQGYLLNLSRALMSYGAPTHLLEDYMRISSRVLEIDGQYLYIPGCMIISFGDQLTHTAEVKIMRVNQFNVDLGKLQETHHVYDEVVHHRLSAEQASDELEKIWQKKPLYSPWVCVLYYGLASATVGPIGFDAQVPDIPIAFILGCLLGIMHLIIAPRSKSYTNVFEVSAAVVTSFLARAFGSIRGGSLFCFSSLAKSSIANILPGYVVLCSTLELQSRNIVAGSVRMLYAIIYSLFLSFGVTIGTTLYGAIDSNATSEVKCRRPIHGYWPFLFVIPFTLCMIIINQGKKNQMLVMIFIASVSYLVNHFTATRFAEKGQISPTLGALTIGILGNLYSRYEPSLSAAALLLPAIFLQGPSGLASNGSIISGLKNADQITHLTMNATTNGTQAGTVEEIDMNQEMFRMGYKMIQIAVGMTVGLLLGSFLIYPFGKKKRNGLFSF